MSTQPQDEQSRADAHPVGSSGLVARWSEDQIERALKVKNDIAENIDCRETRAVLRECIAIWVDHYCDAQMELQSLKDQIALDDLERRMVSLMSATV